MDWSDHHNVNTVTDHHGIDDADLAARRAPRQTIVKEQPCGVEFGSGWYHDIAIADAHDIGAHPYR